MSDERLKGLPVLTRVPGGRPDQTEESGRAPGVQTRQDPPLLIGLQLDVPGPHQLGVSHIDEPVAQDVLPQEHLPVAAFESPQVDLRLGQDDSLFAELSDPLDGHEHRAASDLGHQSGDHRIVPTAQADDDVVDLAHTLARRRQQLVAQQPGQMHVGSVHEPGSFQEKAEDPLEATNRAVWIGLVTVVAVGGFALFLVVVSVLGWIGVPL